VCVLMHAAGRRVFPRKHKLRTERKMREGNTRDWLHAQCEKKQRLEADAAAALQLVAEESQCQADAARVAAAADAARRVAAGGNTDETAMPGEGDEDKE
jgi:hypothetical protein